MSRDIRWMQRFENYEMALGLLREALSRVDRLSTLEKEGAVQRFEFTFELAWKTLKDYLEFDGVPVPVATPKQVLKEAFRVNIISNGHLWIEMLDCRNEMSHTYDEEAFEVAVQKMADRYLNAFEELYQFFKPRMT